MITSLCLEGKHRAGGVAYRIILVLFMIEGVHFVRQKVSVKNLQKDQTKEYTSKQHQVIA